VTLRISSVASRLPAQLAGRAYLGMYAARFMVEGSSAVVAVPGRDVWVSALGGSQRTGQNLEDLGLRREVARVAGAGRTAG